MGEQQNSMSVLDSIAQQQGQQQQPQGPSSLDVLNDVAAGKYERNGSPQPLTPDEMNEVQAFEAKRPAWRRALGLPSDDPRAQQLQNKAIAYQSDKLAKSEFFRQQLGDKAAGAAVVAAVPATTAAITGVGALAAPTVGTATVGTGVLDAAGKEITREAVTYGPSLLRTAATSSLAKIAYKWIAGGAAYGLARHLLGVWGKGIE